MDWNEFKEKEKIFVGDYGAEHCPDNHLLLETEDEKRKKESFENLITILENAKIPEYKISPLTNEDGEYTGCYIESVTIGEMVITGISVDPYDREEELQSYAKLEISQKKKDG